MFGVKTKHYTKGHPETIISGGLPPTFLPPHSSLNVEDEVKSIRRGGTRTQWLLVRYLPDSGLNLMSPGSCRHLGTDTNLRVKDLHISRIYMTVDRLREMRPNVILSRFTSRTYHYDVGPP